MSNEYFYLAIIFLIVVFICLWIFITYCLVKFFYKNVAEYEDLFRFPRDGPLFGRPQKKKIKKRQKLEEQKGEIMDPVLALGVLGSLASIISLLQQNNEAITPLAILNDFRLRQSKKGTIESVLGPRLTDDQIMDEATITISIGYVSDLFLQRIKEKCILPYHEKILDYGLDNIEVDDAYEHARRCVCENIKMARRENGGVFPSDAFKDLWKQFQCGM